MITLNKRTIRKPSRDSLKKANNLILGSYLLAFGQPAVDLETGKELSKPAMLEILFKFLGYSLADPEKLPLPKPGAPPRALVEVLNSRDREDDGEKDDTDDDAGNGTGEDE
jgi:hypothetical protein